MTQGKNRNSYEDNLCFIRCLAQCLVGNFEDSSSILSYFSTYCKSKRINITTKDFCGVTYTDLEVLEDLFQVDIQVSSIDKSKLATCWRNSLGNYSIDRLLNLNVSITLNAIALNSIIRHIEQ